MTMQSSNDTKQSGLGDRLSDFENLLKYTADDHSAMQNVFRTIRELLAQDHDAEAELRRLVDQTHADGELDDRTYLTIKRMLDRVVFDFHATMPEDDEDYVNTHVISQPANEPDTLAERLQAGSVLRDRFLLQRKVAGGSMGVVYKALDRRLAEVDDADPWVAIKVLTPKLSRNAVALRAMQQEAAKGRCLSHPNIVRFIDLDREDDLYFIVMEWIEGRSLAAILDDPNEPAFDLPTNLRIARQIGNALDYAHRCGVIHADVKPGNIMMLPNGDVKLIDFGVARIRQKQSKRLSKFDPGVMGAATPAYSSMQVLTGEEPVPTDDVFSLGCLMYRLIAGHRVFGPRNAAEAAEAGMAPQRPPGLSGRQWKALKRSLAFSRVARQPSPKVFVEELLGNDAAKADAAPTAMTPTVDVDIDVERPMPSSPRRWPLFAGLLAVIAGVGFVATQTNYLDGPLARVQTEFERLTSDRTPPPSEERSNVTSAAVESTSSSSPDAASTDADEDTVADISEATPLDPLTDELDGAGQDTELRTADGEALPDGAEEIVDPASREAGEVIDAVVADAADSDLSAPLEDTVVASPEAGREPTHTVFLATAGDEAAAVDIVLREDEVDAVIELRRTTDVGLPLSLRLDEVGFSGNRSPWETGQYRVANDGVVRFAAGQSTSQTVITMMSDPLREADRQVNLVLREIDAPDAELALLNLVLEDDDQRRFEGELLPNTVAFAVSQVSVGEADPAVQIDVLRFNPDSRAVSVRYEVQDVTATEGEDYFSPSSKVLTFAPGQRSARLLIPLVQDSALESDEAFFLEIVGQNLTADADIFRRIAVMIRDDDR